MTSGTVSQNTMRSSEEDRMDAQTFVEMAKDLAANGTEEFAMEDDGS